MSADAPRPIRRLAWATDIHLDFLDDDGVDGFYAQLADSGADAVALTGDIAVARTLPDFLGRLEERLERPIFFVLGNHDFYGGSIGAVREAVARLTEGSENLRWMPAGGVIPLDGETAVVGHDGWADARLGSWATTDIRLNDYRLIEELSNIDHETRGRKLNALGDEAASHLAGVLGEALARFRHVIVLLHPPPFADACRYMGFRSSARWLPHLACGAAGEVLLAAARAHEDRRITVLCGHTHGAADEAVLPNLRVRVGAADYGRPTVQAIIETA